MTSLADARVRTILRDAMIVDLATVSAKRRPFVTPIWFVAEDGVLYMTTGTGTRAAKNIAAQPAVTLLFAGAHAERAAPVLRVRGTATCHAGLPPWRVLVRIAAKYYLSPSGLGSELANVAKWRLRVRYYAQVAGGPGHLRVVPAEAELLPRP